MHALVALALISAEPSNAAAQLLGSAKPARTEAEGRVRAVSTGVKKIDAGHEHER